MLDGQIEVFEEYADDPIFKPTTTCSNCKHIIGVRFQRSNLFFCSIQGKGEYGRKIKKSNPNCKFFEDAGDTLIPHGEGYYGGFASKGLKR